MMALQASAELGHDNETRFAVLMHDLGKASTPADILPSHHGHEARGKKPVTAFCKRWRVPRAHTDLALITTELHLLAHRCQELKSSTLLKLFIRADSLRKPERFEKMLEACRADIRGRIGYENDSYPQAKFLAELSRKLGAMDISEIRQRELSGKDMGDAIHQARLQLIEREKCSAVQD
jgi:tRNA nucleotidyltransferase (CCA-adding enzyme)